MCRVGARVCPAGLPSRVPATAPIAGSVKGNNGGPVTITRISSDISERIAASTEPVVIVTGASSGIGAATVRDLAADHLVIAVGRDAGRLQHVVDVSRADAVIALAVDLTDFAAVADAFAALPRLDALVNNAAVMFRTSAATLTPEQFREMLDVNVVAPANLTRLLLPPLTAARGTIVFTGSGASRNPVPNHIAYASSKYALQGYTDTLRLEVAGDGVRVTTVAPGPTATVGAYRMDGLPDDSAAGDRIDPSTIARSIRHVVDAPADTQLTEVWVRPRVERR